MGVDPGLAATGWGVVRAAGADAAYVDSGVIATAASQPHVERLRAIAGGLGEALARAAPDLIAVERVFVSKNLKSSLLLGEARGAAIAALLDGGSAPIIEISALQIKQSVTGAGRAGKKQVADMVGRLLGMSTEGFAADATDALACALAARAMHAGLGRRAGARRRSGGWRR